MKIKASVWGILVALIALAACESATATITPPPTLPANLELNQRALEAHATAQAEYARMLDAQRVATSAAADAQRVATFATAAAVSTRDALATEATRQALRDHATRQVEIARANEIATTHAAQFTATAHAHNLAATATMQASIVEQTRVAVSATATAHAANARATRFSAEATATMSAISIRVAEEKAEWQRRLEAGHALATFSGGILGLLAFILGIGFAALKILDALVLRARVIRDQTGVPFVILEPDRRGRQTLLAPTRQPGAVTILTPADEQPLQIEAGAVDGDTTRRDQTIALMVAAKSGSGNAARAATHLPGEPRVRIVNAPPPELVASGVVALLDAQWKEVQDARASND